MGSLKRWEWLRAGAGLCRRTACFAALLLSQGYAFGQPVTLVASVLPASRSIQVGGTATAFATVINAGTSSALNCSIVPVTPVPAIFTYQSTDPATNAPIGSANSPVTIGPGAAQSFVIAFKATSAFDSTDVELAFACSNAAPATSIAGVNTLLLSATLSPSPDIVALGATQTNDGIVNIPGPPGTGFFAVATSNVGASGQMTVTADTGSVVVPLSPSVCQTEPATGACLSPPSGKVTTTISGGATPTFAIFLNAIDGISFDPAKTRVFLRFRDQAGTTRGATSVAARTSVPTGSKIYLGYYTEDPGNNPEDPMTGSILVKFPSADGTFSGQMPFSYLGCTGSRSVGQISGGRSGNSVSGNWAGTVDGIAAGGAFSGIFDNAADAVGGAYANAGGKLPIASGACSYYVAALGTWKAFGSMTNVPATFVARATNSATPIVSWPNIGAGAIYSVRIFDESCLIGNPGMGACFVGEAVTTATTVSYPLNFPGASSLSAQKSYLVLVTGAPPSGGLSGFSTFRLQP